MGKTGGSSGSRVACDLARLRFAAERHVTVARPFKAGFECP